MAGIGFELKRVLLKGGIARAISVGLAGTAIVAGPWLLSVLGIVLVQRIASPALAEAPIAFMAAIITVYAASLVLASGGLYVFTRQVSDLVFEGREREAGSALEVYLLATFAASALVAAGGLAPMAFAGVVARPGLFIAAVGALFVVVNLNWVLLSFVSMLKSYLGILLAYLGGSLASLAGVISLGGAWETAGALAGYGFGQLVIAITLSAMSFARFPPARPRLRPLLLYFRRYRLLFLAGACYACASWADKVICWIAFGRTVPGTWFRIYDPYDVPVFVAMLTLIPSLVYFTVETETRFYPRLQQFLAALGTGTLAEIVERRRDMVRSLAAGFGNQTLLQAICTAVAILLAPQLDRALFAGAVSQPVLRLTLGAVFFHATFIALMIFLFYFEEYGRALAATLVFFGINVAASLGLAWFGRPDLAGSGYLAGGLAGCVVAGILLARSLARIERTLFLRATRVR